MKRSLKMTGRVLLAAMLLMGNLALAVGKQPVGKVSIAEKQFGLLLSGSTGGGAGHHSLVARCLPRQAG